MCVCVRVCMCLFVRACVYIQHWVTFWRFSLFFDGFFFSIFVLIIQRVELQTPHLNPPENQGQKKKKSPVCSVIFYPQWVEKWWNHSFGRVGAQCVTQTALTEIWTRVADSVLLLVFCFVNRLIMVGTWEGVACALFKWFSIPRIIRTTD